MRKHRLEDATDPFEIAPLFRRLSRSAERRRAIAQHKFSMEEWWRFSTSDAAAATSSNGKAKAGVRSSQPRNVSSFASVIGDSMYMPATIIFCSADRGEMRVISVVAPGLYRGNRIAATGDGPYAHPSLVRPSKRASVFLTGNGVASMSSG